MSVVLIAHTVVLHCWTVSPIRCHTSESLGSWHNSAVLSKRMSSCISCYPQDGVLYAESLSHVNGFQIWFVSSVPRIAFLASSIATFCIFHMQPQFASVSLDCTQHSRFHSTMNIRGLCIEDRWEAIALNSPSCTLRRATKSCNSSLGWYQWRRTMRESWRG